MAPQRRAIGDASLQLAEDYAQALAALEARSEAATTAVLRQSLQGVLRELKRAYGRYAAAAEPNGRDPQGRPLQRSGAAVMREATARLRSILEISQGFLSDEELGRWRQQLQADLNQAQQLGGDLSEKLAALNDPKAARTFGGANGPAIEAATRNAGAYLAAEGAKFRDQLVEIVGEGAARGWGSKRLEDQIQRALEGAGDPTGKTARLGLRQRAALIARSELASAYVQGQLEHSRRQGFDYVRWIAVADERSCPFCLARHGQIFVASKVVTPAHPRCRCVTSPVPREVVEMEAGDERDGLLDQAFWRDSREEAVKEYAKEKAMTIEAAQREIRRHLKVPTASERRRFPGALESLLPSVPLET